jgi:hypothetical protein
MNPDYPYVWRWKKRFLRVLDRYGQPCRIVTRGLFNSVLIEFEDGYKAVVSRNGLRRWQDKMKKS